MNSVSKDCIGQQEVVDDEVLDERMGPAHLLKGRLSRCIVEVIILCYNIVLTLIIAHAGIGYRSVHGRLDH